MFQLHAYPSVDSTNDEALRLWTRNVAGGDRSPLLVSADRQTAGKGRLQRPWQSPEGGLWMSVAWPLRRQPEHYQPLPLVVGLTVAETLHQLCKLDAQLKWPNDLIWHDRKFAGMLCQLEVGHAAPVAILGIGINANFPAERLRPGLRQPATTLLDIIGKEVHLQTLRIALAARLQYRLAQFDRSGLIPVAHALRRRLAWRGRDVNIELPDGEKIFGNLIGLDFDGRLLVRTHDTTHGVQSLTVGEILHLSAPPRPADTPPPAHPPRTVAPADETPTPVRSALHDRC